MTLGLILATRQTLSTPEESIANPQRSVLTPISFTSFPCYVEDRARLLRGRAESKIPVVPSFKDVLLHRLVTFPHRTLPNTMATNCSTYERHQELLDRVQSTHLNSRLKENPPFYYHYPDDEPSDFERLQRRGKDPLRMTRMYLTVATLIVVPVNLLSQWEREIHKHCEYPLRVLVVRSKTKLPATRALASDYDVGRYFLYSQWSYSFFLLDSFDDHSSCVSFRLVEDDLTL